MTVQLRKGEQPERCPLSVWSGKTPDLPCSGLRRHAEEWRAKAAHWSLLHACRSVKHSDHARWVACSVTSFYLDLLET